MLCVLYIRWKVPILQLGRRWLVFDSSLLRKTVSYGWASAMQQATVQLGKIYVYKRQSRPCVTKLLQTTPHPSASTPAM